MTKLKYSGSVILAWYFRADTLLARTKDLDKNLSYQIIHTCDISRAKFVTDRAFLLSVNFTKDKKKKDKELAFFISNYGTTKHYSPKLYPWKQKPIKDRILNWKGSLDSSMPHSPHMIKEKRNIITTKRNSIKRRQPLITK